ncbi:helix-turn-helix transcriptional regulator [Streptomyces olivaceiscleroticus]|uniref:Helix-turn-helix transcriptional regulator n=1 Tax=Streptomyces olivaceiscleroticus TaxID=68245 RepID=A0ABP3JAC9_9ACTN
MAAEPRELFPGRSARDFFGAELRRERLAARLSLAQLAEIVRYSKTHLGNVETADRSIPPGLPSALDAAFGTDGHFARLYELARREPHPGKYRGFMALEAQAATIEDYAAQTVPGLLQTEEYARALLRVDDNEATDEEIEEKVSARLSRQELLRAPCRPYFWAVLDEAVLRRPVGGRGTMHDQLAGLLPLMDTRYTTIQVLPFDHGEHALMNIPLILITLPNKLTVAYEETGYSGQLIDHEATVAKRKRAYDALRAYALSPAESATLIRAVMKEYKRCEQSPT